MAIYQGFYLPLLSMPLSIIGLIDDKYNIPRFIRLITQISTLIFVLVFFGDNTLNLFSEIIGSRSITFYFYYLLAHQLLILLILWTV